MTAVGAAKAAAAAAAAAAAVDPAVVTTSTLLSRVTESGTTRALAERVVSIALGEDALVQRMEVSGKRRGVGGGKAGAAHGGEW